MPSTTPAITKRYYPRLSEIASLDDMPASLSFLQSGINAIFNKIHYKNFQYTKSPNGDTAFYSLDIVSSKKLSLSLPGGIGLVLNPDATDANISAFPVSLEYQWGILGFINGINLKTFKFTPKEFFDLGLKVFKLTDSQLLAHVLNNFVTPANNNTNSYQQLVNDINSKFNTAIIPPPNDNEDITSFVTRVKKQGNFNDSLGFILFQLYIIGSSEQTTKNNIEKFYEIIVPGGIENYLRELITPKIKAKFQLSAGIEFPRTMLLPVFDENGNNPLGGTSGTAFTIIPESPANSGNPKVVLKFGEADFYADSETGLGYSMNLVLSTNFPAQIGNTGLIISIRNVKIDLSTTSNIAEADADGRPADFMGVYIQDATILLPKSWGLGSGTAAIKGKNLLMGTGGFSGALGLEAINPNTQNPIISFNLGGFTLSISAFALNFHQNSITQCAIKGTLKFPSKYKKNGAEAILDVEVMINENGDFKITAIDSPSNNALNFKFLDVFNFDILSLSFGRTNNKFYADMAATLNFETNQNSITSSIPPGILPTNIAIKKLRVWEDGSIEFEAGGLSLPTAFKMKIGPVAMTVSGLHFGSIEQYGRKYNYFGFDGSINVNPGGVDARGNGIKFYYTVDDAPASGNTAAKLPDSYLRIDGIAIDMRFPSDAKSEETADTVIKGFLSVTDVTPSTASPTQNAKRPESEYAGGVQFTLNKLKMAGSASMRYNASKPAFMLDIGLEFGSPLLLGTTGLGIYGFRGLLGMHYLPSKQQAGLAEEDSYWKYYKAKNANKGIKNPDWNREGIHVGKFDAERNGTSVGAGVALATAGDGGRVFSSKLFAMLNIPGGFALQGQMQVLKNRIGLNDTNDPPFSFLLVINEKQVSLDAGINYNLPSAGSNNGEGENNGGSILALQAQMEMAYFFNDASAWYINIGKDKPETALVKAKIMSLFNGYSYLMLSAKGIKAGAGASFDYNASYGPVALGAGFALNAGGFINFKPTQLGGFIGARGYAYARVFGFKFGFDVGMAMAAELPKPFVISGSFYVKISLPWPFDDIGFDVSIRWEKDKNLNTQALPVLDAQSNIASAVNMLTGETFEVKIINGKKSLLTGTELTNITNDNYINPYIIPMDSYIDIDFAQGVGKSLGALANKIGDVTGDNVTVKELVPPLPVRPENQVLHQFKLKDINIYYLDKTNSWQPYDVYKSIDKYKNTEELGYIGFWQKSTKGKNNRLRILAGHPFSFTQQAQPGSFTIENIGMRLKTIFCGGEIIEDTIVNWMHEEAEAVGSLGTTGLANYTAPFQYKNGLKLFIGDSGERKSEFLITIPQEDLPTGYPTEFNKYLEFGIIGENYILFYKPIYKTKIYIRTAWKGTELENNYNISLNIIYYLRNQKIEEQLIEEVNTLENSPIGNTIGKHFDKIVFKLLPITLKVQPPVISDMYIGCASPDDPYVISGQNTNWPGFISDIIIYNKAINNEGDATTILANINPFRNENLILKWEFDNSITPIINNTSFSPSFSMLYGVATIYNNNSYYSNYNNKYTLEFDNNIGYKIDKNDVNFDTESFTLSLGFILKAEWIPSSTNQTRLTLIDKRNIGNNPNQGLLIYLIKDLNDGTMQLACEYTPAEQPTVFLILPSIIIEDGNHYTCFISVDKTKGTVAFGLKDNTSEEITNVTGSIYGIARQYTNILKLRIYNINYTTVDDYLHQEGRLTNQQIRQNLTVMKRGINDLLQPIWRPETTFAIELITSDTVNGTENEKHTTIAFKTKSPVGDYHKFSKKYKLLKDVKSEAEFKYTNLIHYTNHELSYPNTEGKLINAKPLYYGNPKLYLLFKENYVRLMYDNWSESTIMNKDKVESSMKLVLIDSTGTQQPENSGNWVTNNLKIQKQEHLTLSYLALRDREVNCDVNFGSYNRKLEHKVFQLTSLKPNALYTAAHYLQYKVNNTSLPNSPLLLNYNFVTSKYENFGKLINSYGLLTNRQLFTISANTLNATQKQSLLDIVNGTLQSDNALLTSYSNNYDRILYGLLKLSSGLKSKNGLEIHKLKNGTDTVALLILCDEPIYANYLAGIKHDLIECLNAAGLVINVKLIWNEDLSGFIILSNSLTNQNNLSDILASEILPNINSIDKIKFKNAGYNDDLTINHNLTSATETTLNIN